jgi:hypothetical protein
LLGVTASSVSDPSSGSLDDDPCRLVSQRDATVLFGAPATQVKDFNGTMTSGHDMTYCDWTAHSKNGHVQGSIDYELIVGVMKYSLIGHYIEQPFATSRPLLGIADKAVYAKLSDTATTVQFVKNGRLVVLNDGVGPYVAQNLNKGLDQADRLISTARVVAARIP